MTEWAPTAWPGHMLTYGAYLEGTVVQERDWIMMAVVNLGAVLEYGRPNAVLRRISGIGGREAHIGKASVSPIVANAAAGRVKLMAKKAEDDEKRMDIDDEDVPPEALCAHHKSSPMLSDTIPSPSKPALPPALSTGMQLAFSMLAHVLEKPMRKSSPFAHSTLNPYITIFLTFLTTTLKDSHALAILERAIPWNVLAKFLESVPRRIMYREFQKECGDGAPLLTSRSKPLAEDWCLRGMGWSGKKVYAMGFWSQEAASEEHNIEMEVLDKVESGDQTDGIIEDGDDDDSKGDPMRGELCKRWVCVAPAGLKIAKYVKGFHYVPPPSGDGRGQWKVDGVLAEKVSRWQEEDRCRLKRPPRHPTTSVHCSRMQLGSTEWHPRSNSKSRICANKSSGTTRTGRMARFRMPTSICLVFLVYILDPNG